MTMTVRQMADHAALRWLQQEGQPILDINREGGELSIQFMSRVRGVDLIDPELDEVKKGAPQPCVFRHQEIRLDLGCPKVAQKAEQKLSLCPYSS